MALGITLCLILLGFLLKKSKTVYAAQFMWVWIIWSFNQDYNRPDYGNYYNAFVRAGNEKFQIINSEFSYKLINKILYSAGLDFDQALAIIYLMIIIILAISIPLYTKYICVPVSLFMIYPNLNSGIQIRNTISMALILFAIHYLLEDKPKNTIKYCFFVLLATTFHTTAIFYFLFLLCKFLKKKSLWFVTISGILLFAFSPKILVNIFGNVFGLARILSKFMGSNSYLEMFLAICWQLSLSIIIFLMIRLQSKDKHIYLKHGLLDNDGDRFKELIERINIILLIYTPLYLVDFSFERLFRNMLILFFCFYINWSITNKECGKLVRSMCSIISFIWFAATVFYFMFIYRNLFEVFGRKYFTENLVIKNVFDYSGLLLSMVIILIIIFVMDICRIRICWNKKR